MKKLYIFFIYGMCLLIFSTFFILPVEASDKKRNIFTISAIDIYSGWYTDTRGQGYEYLGAGLDHDIDNHQALTAKIFTSYQYYKYESGTDIIKAKAPELKLLIGKKYFYSGKYLVLTGGMVTKNTSLNPDDKSSSSRGSKTGLILEADYSKDLSGILIMNLLGDYSTIGSSLWGRGRLKYLFKNKAEQKVFIGAEGIGEGNSDYSAYRLGPIIEIQKIKHNFSVLFSLGYKHSNSILSCGYFSIELYHRF